jgi:hypothetical protein
LIQNGKTPENLGVLYARKLKTLVSYILQLGIGIQQSSDTHNAVKSILISSMSRFEDL